MYWLRLGDRLALAAQAMTLTSAEGDFRFHPGAHLTEANLPSYATCRAMYYARKGCELHTV